MIAVFDLDGTLADCDHRVHLAQAQEWEEFHSLQHLDTLIAGTYQMYLGVSLMHSVIVCTGRPEKYRLQTLRWLTENKIFVDGLLMRPDNDWRRDGDCKTDLLYNALGSKETALELVAFVVDDRDSMVQRWREEGFACFQARPGAY